MNHAISSSLAMLENLYKSSRDFEKENFSKNFYEMWIALIEVIEGYCSGNMSGLEFKKTIWHLNDNDDLALSFALNAADSKEESGVLFTNLSLYRPGKTNDNRDK